MYLYGRQLVTEAAHWECKECVPVGTEGETFNGAGQLLVYIGVDLLQENIFFLPWRNNP
jgi:hypothetical protein